MTAEYTWDVFTTLDGFGSYGPDGDWGGYWSKQGPELLAYRASLFDTPQRMVFGATTFRENADILLRSDDPHTQDEWNRRTLSTPATVVSSTLHDTLGWPDATIVSGDAAQIVTRLKEESDIPLRSQASLSLNRSLLAAGLVDRIELTIFPVISGATGTSPVLAGLGDYDLDLLESQTFDGRSQLLVYRPTAHRSTTSGS
jgi:dihydrofolate reductase